MTPEAKLALYRAGHYRLPPPPVSTGFWSEADWIRYIDQSGSWKLEPDEIFCAGERWVRSATNEAGQALYSLAT